MEKGCKPDNFKSHNSLKHSFTNIRNLRSNFVNCKCFFESNSPDIFALCETNLDHSTDSGNFFTRGYLPLIREGSVIHMHGLGFYVKEVPCERIARDLSIENSADSYQCFHVLLLFPLSITSSSLCTVCDAISSNIDEILSINPSANVFVLGDLNLHHKDWLTFSGGTD